ncbi:hypothetical protein [Jannaschia sp. R86511]|uniref:hypothetical protein n=1 Tax=Jannaschia sp. R86511 TaxID=3093853 RepID=UPI0036D4083B
MAEALAHAATTASSLQLIILRRTAGLGTDIALVAAVEDAADREYTALRAQLPALLPAWALHDGQLDVIRTTRAQTLNPPRPSRVLTTRVLRLAHHACSELVITPHGLLQPLDPSLTGIRIITVPHPDPTRHPDHPPIPVQTSPNTSTPRRIQPVPP